jgi:hypothetical protein
MLSALKRLIGISREPRPPVHDDVLGQLTYDPRERWWVATVSVPTQPLTFYIGGEEPTPALVAHARDIVGNFEQFQTLVREFLDVEAARFKTGAQEVRSLTIESVCLFWPKRPNDGMIYFSAPNEDRVWRCDYVGRKPVGLGFDS